MSDSILSEEINKTSNLSQSEKNEEFFDYEGLEDECEDLEEIESFIEDSSIDLDGDFNLYEKSSLHKYESKSPSTMSHLYQPPFKIKCLGEVTLSRSSELFNPYRYFEDLVVDVDLSDHLWAPKIYPTYDDIGVERYKDLAKEYKAPIIRDIVNQLATEKMILKYYGLNDRSYKILLEVMKFNKHIKHLDLTNNEIKSIDSAKAFAEMIKDNDTLEIINLTFCNIGPEYMKIISEHIEKNKQLKELNLSHCNIGDVGCSALAEELAQNTGLQKLDLSFNNLTANCCQNLADFIFDNNDIMDLNFCGNNFKEPGFGTLVSSLRDNFAQKIAYVNLSKCHLGWEMDKSLKILTLKVTGLKYLDLSFNQLTGPVIDSIAFGMRRNSNLLELNLGYNPLTPFEIITLIETLKVMRPARKLKVLDLSDKYVPSLCKDIIEKLKNKRTVIFRGYLCDFYIEVADQKIMYIKRLNAICEPKSKRAKAQKNFGSFFYNINVDYVKEADFPSYFENICECEKVMKDRDFIKGLAAAFLDQTKKVNVGMLRDLYLSVYPETPKPPPPNEESQPAPIIKTKKGKSKKRKAKK